MSFEKLAADAKPEKTTQEIDEMISALDRWRNKLEKNEKYYEKRRKELPEKLYHITTRQKLKQILEEGLEPSKLIFENKEVVSLSDDIDFAVKIATKTQHTTPSNLVVLEIDTGYLIPSRIENYLREADSDNPDSLDAAAIHEVHYESNIPPEVIRLIK